MKSKNNLDWLSDGAQFIEMLAQDPSGNSVDLDMWQQKYIRDDAPLISALKSRRVGFSWIEAAKGIYRSQTVIRKTMAAYVYEKFFISRNLQESKEKITLARHLFNMFPDRIEVGSDTIYKMNIISDAKTELVFEDLKGRQTRLSALTAQEPRGPGGDINIDEIAHIKNAKDIYQSALYMTEQHGQLSIGSTPAGQSGLFFDISTNRIGPDGKKMYPGFKRYKIPWWLSNRLCTDVLRASIEAPKLTTKDRVERFGTKRLQQIFFSTTLENFIRECECGFMDESIAFMPYELIWSCREQLYDDDPKDSEATYFFESFVNSDKEKEPPESFWRKIREQKKGFIEIGIDIGRRKDETAIVISDETHGVWCDRAILELRQMPFPLQEKIIDDAIRIIQPGAIRIDQNGIGMQLTESMQFKHGSIIQGVSFSNASKADMATKVKVAFEKRATRIPDHPEYIDHIHSIQRTITGNLFQYEADSSEHHGDLFWAKALTMYRDAGVVTEYQPKFQKGDRLRDEDFPR